MDALVVINRMCDELERELLDGAQVSATDEMKLKKIKDILDEQMRGV